MINLAILGELPKVFFDNWKLIAVIVFTMAVYSCGDHNGSTRIYAKWEAAEAARIQAEQARLINVQKGVIDKERQGVSITTKVAGAYESDLSYVDTLFSGSLSELLSNQAGAGSRGGALPAIPNAAGSVNGSPVCGISTEEKVADLKLKRIAQRQAYQLKGLQAWVKEQGEVNE